MIFTEFIAGQRADLLNPRNRGMYAAKRDNDNETGGLLNRWICLLNCMCCYCHRFVPSLIMTSEILARAQVRELFSVQTNLDAWGLGCGLMRGRSPQ